VNLGLVAFAGTAAVLVSPTTDRAAVKRAVDSLRLSESTATGEAIFAAMSSVETFSQSVSGTQDGPPPARIVLMSDGKQTVPGPDGENEARGAFTAARKAAEAKVPVSTISFGTDYGSIEIDGERTSVAVTTRRCGRSRSSRAGSSSPPRPRASCGRSTRSWCEQIGYEMRRVDASRPWLMGAALLLAAGCGRRDRARPRLP
jgi:Ca-activated chloride channel family protein